MSPQKCIPLSLGIAILAVACSKLVPGAPSAASVMNAPLSELTPDQLKVFNAGAAEFDEEYASATGLGPIYVSTSCNSCHAGDNRGHMHTILTRFGQSDTFGNTWLDKGGPQLQQHALAGFTGETLPAGVPFSRFLAPLVAGSGFLEAVTESDLLALADPEDKNSDGISGRPNYSQLPAWVVPLPGSAVNHGRFMGRFGRKAAAHNLHQQSVNAFQQDMGITTTFLPRNPVNPLNPAAPVTTTDPDVTDAAVNDVVFYLQTLQMPPRRNVMNADVVKGSEIFRNIGCASCHTETLKTGYSPVAALSYKEFHPYTDLLLHDMGPELNDGYTEGNALPSEWRTTPLWGLGLASSAQGGRVFLLHDGRAHSIEAAIQYHGGEAAASRTAFRNLSSADKSALLSFLNSL
ncbi:MAG: thiol oxidoreductase [Bacteroidetes bacterium]|nr:thiol oxidoreductase [Bacteroidota bacterium]